MCIALAPTSAVGHYNALALVLTIPEYLVGIGILADRPNRHTNDQILAAFAVHILAFAMRAALGKVEGMIVQIQQGVHGSIALHDDGPAIAPVATVWPATRNKLLTAKAEAAISPLATTHQDSGLINDA